MITLRNIIVYNSLYGNKLNITSTINRTLGLQDTLINCFRKLSITGYLWEENTDDKLVEYGIKEDKSSKAMRAYLERSRAYNLFMEQEENEYKTGKRHLANMMGKDPETFTQDDVNEAISYLFPSGLFVLKTRPFLKPPQEVHPPKKEAQFDETGRPFHYQFYTAKPNFYEYLHGLVDVMKELNTFEDTMIRKQLQPDPALSLSQEGHHWLSKEEFEKKFIEPLSDEEYRHVTSILNRLLAHPYSYRVPHIFNEARQNVSSIVQDSLISKPELQEDGREFVTHKGARRKTASADVTVRSPGTGVISINGEDLSYFQDFQAREQLLFPLQFTGMLNNVDVEATVTAGGPSTQAGAIRLGIAMALRSFVPLAMVEQMRLAGLLTKDIRRKERKKPGQEGARRKFTWKKR